MRCWIFVFMLVGCGELQDSPTSGLSLEIHLPGALSRTEARRARFEERVSRLELQLRSKSGIEKSLSYSPKAWDRVSVGDIHFPATGDDRLQVLARVWDLQRDGTQRVFPALSGSLTIKAPEMALQGPTIVPLRLSLRVPVSEYD